LLNALLSACTLRSKKDDKKEDSKPGITITDSSHVKLVVTKHTAGESRPEIFERRVDLTKMKVDAYFSHGHFDVPYYMPTNSIYKDSTKDKECNYEVYPATVSCYEYDNKNRVTKMQVEGSGTTGSHTFKYDENDRIVETTQHSKNYKLSYDKNGNLLSITGGGIQLDFQYTN
jgi:YD repeat-containing protein